jgi:hypothetical protein
MRVLWNATLLAPLVLFVVACAGFLVDPNTLLVDFVCNPEGATLYQDQQVDNASPTNSLNTCPATFVACRSPYVTTARTFGPPNTLTAVGTCPSTLQYKITDQDKARGYISLRGITAYWVSGASSSVNSINANLQNGRHQNFRFERPRDFPNYETDANYALNLEKLRIMRAQAEAQETQAAIATLNNAVAAANAAFAAPVPAPNLGTHCTTRFLGNTAYTDCY